MIYATYPNLADKRVVITGGGTGIGAELVTAFVQQGAKVTFLDIAKADSEALAAQLAQGAKHAPKFVYCNLMDLDMVGKVFADIEAADGTVEILVNNAANDDRHTLDKVDGAYWDNRMAVNLRHLYFAAKAVAPGMTKAGGGVILNFGSISWHLALPDLTLYMTAKAAIEGMSRGLARDLGPSNIRVNTIIPGAVRTPRQEALWTGPEEGKRIMDNQLLKQRVEVQDVAALTLFLASDNARACTGREYWVDAGWYGA
ncbi:MAG: SDR family NAD(P)-dependent oxidoreductase [Gammaproteobacteria bacterium]